jgi:TPR repeat protein
MYQEGRGVIQEDSAEAERWFKRALATGIQKSCGKSRRFAGDTPESELNSDIVNSIIRELVGMQCPGCFPE